MPPDTFDVVMVGAACFSLTVTLQLEDTLPQLAVTVAVPAFIAEILPSLTVTTDGLLLVHVMLLLVALSGFTVATKAAVSPSASIKNIK